MALTKVTAAVLDGSLGTDWQADIKTADFNATNGEGYFVNTTSGSVTATLPVGTPGDEITFQDYSGTFDVNSINFTPNGSQKIQGVESDYSCSTKDATVRLIYQDDTQGWNGNNIVINPSTEDVHFLVVAGGGGGSGGYGGSPQGSGGAGGLRTSWGSLSGGGNSAENTIAITIGTNYTVTIGAGGSGAVNSDGQIGSPGGTSQFGTITTVGGGGSRNWSSSLPSGTGGSGGGQAYPSNGGPGAGTANQGFAGGSVTVNGPGAGGGGAGSAGSWAASPTFGIGGNGINIDITGSTVSYAGGGGRTLGTPPGGGGLASNGYSAGGNGTANTGGGGGGGANSGGNYTGGSGGTGVVVLRYSSGMSITIPGGLTATTSVVGSDKVTIFTAGTGNIQFT